MDDLINAVDKSISGQAVSWIACGADLNAHFSGCGLPPHRKDDFAAKEVRRFMLKFGVTCIRNMPWKIHMFKFAWRSFVFGYLFSK